MTEKYFESEFSREKYISLKGLINNNDGLFKSRKQSEYYQGIGSFDHSNDLEYLGMDLDDDEFRITAGGEYNFDPDRWGSMHKAIRPYRYLFIADQWGIKKLYYLTGKIVRKGNGGRVVWTNHNLEWERPEDLEIEDWKPEPGENSEWVGEKGEKIEKIVDLMFKTTFENQWGLTALYKFMDQEGNIYVWFTSSHPDFSTEAGLKIKAKIKDHDEYKGTKQTVINYVKEVE